MISVFDYLEYREFLRDYYQERRSRFSFFSFRYIGSKVGMDPGYVVKLFQGKVHITEQAIPKFADLCRLDARERVYFENLVLFTKAKTERETKLYFERLVQAKSISVSCLDKEQYEFYQHWFYSAVRSLIGFEGFDGDYRHLARRLCPAITAPQARRAVALLLKLGLVRKDDQGAYTLTNAFITTGDRWSGLAARSFQRESIQLALDALERHHKDARDVSSITISASAADLPEIRERIKEFRRSLLSFINESDNHDEVYQLNVQFFPLTKKVGTR